MNIKVVYGIDMRLWKKRNEIKDGSDQIHELYIELSQFVEKTFGFQQKQYRVAYKDDDGEMTTIQDIEDFTDAFNLAKTQEKKSLKLHITNLPTQPKPEEEGKQFEIDQAKSQSKAEPKKPENPLQSTIGTGAEGKPTHEEINAFLSDDCVIDLLSDLFVSVLDALAAAHFEISFMECLQGIVMSDDGKYKAMTSNKVWPYFMNEILPRHEGKIEQWIVPMVKNGNSEMIKQWIPTILNMMKMKHQKHGGCGQHWQGRHWRGGRGWNQGHWGRGRGRGRGRWGRKKWRNWQGFNQNANDSSFQYTEELVAVMNMGFSDVARIKQLLVKYQGNQESVVQELVNARSNENQNQNWGHDQFKNWEW